MRRRHLFSFVVLAFVISTVTTVHAQTPDAAINHFKTGMKKAQQGDLDGAIEEYSRAISLSSRLQTRKQPARHSGNSFTGADPFEVSNDNIRVIDPFTANAYNNRGLARYQKGDYQGAISDFNEAIRIRPALEA